jgi:hypothetical protein
VLDVKIKSVVINKGTSGNISLQVLASISNSNAKPVKFSIKDESGYVLQSVDDYVATPVEISKFFFLDRDIYPSNKTVIRLEVTDTGGESETVEYVLDTFSIDPLERLETNEFRWGLRNFSSVPVYSIVQILNDKEEVVLNSNEYRKSYDKNFSTYRYKSEEILALPEGNYTYRLKYYSKDENWNRFYPSETGIAMEIRKNEAPKLMIKDTKIRKEETYFALSSRIMFSDSEEDDIFYTITDNLGTMLLDMTSYTYSPKLEHLYHEYPLVHFDSSRLTVTVNVNDKILGRTKVEETIDLFHIYNLHRRNERFRWSFRNYSNKAISMQLEVTDFNGNVITTGDPVTKRSSFDYIDIIDTKEILLEREYYKYRLRVWSVEEGWSKTYAFPITEGIQFTERAHDNPTIEILEASITRDLDNVCHLHLEAQVKDKEKDPFLFEVSDDNGTMIRKARDLVEPPAIITVDSVYDLINKSHANITLSVEDIRNGTASETVEVTAYRISGFSQEKGHIFNWYIDNYSLQNLGMTVEIMTEDEEGKKTVIQTGEEQFIGRTIRSIPFQERLYPKLPAGTYFYRLKVSSAAENWSTYFPHEDGYSFVASENIPSEPEFKSITLDPTDSGVMITIDGMITDEDMDFVNYQLRDSLGNVLYDSGKFVETPLTFKIQREYKEAELNNTRIIFYLDSLDEGDHMKTVTETVYLFDTQNLYQDYEEFYWLFRNFSNKPIDVQVEILGEDGDLEGAGASFSLGNIKEYREYRDIVDFSDYDEGDYFFRLRLSTKNESWKEYYPDINGLPFNIFQNAAPKITPLDLKVVKNGDGYSANVKLSITDENGDKVYFTIKKD